jgi:hypothetical protein
MGVNEHWRSGGALSAPKIGFKVGLVMIDDPFFLRDLVEGTDYWWVDLSKMSEAYLPHMAVLLGLVRRRIIINLIGDLYFARCGVFFTKKWMRHEIPEEPARRCSHTSASLCLDGPTEKYGCIIPRTKSARPRNLRKSWQHSEHLRTAMARTGRYEEEALRNNDMAVET